MQKTEKCHTAILAGGLLFCVSTTPATHHRPLLMATPTKGEEEIKKESTQEAREVESKKASRSYVHTHYSDAMSVIVTKTNALLCSSPGNEGFDGSGGSDNG